MMLRSVGQTSRLAVRPRAEATTRLGRVDFLFVLGLRSRNSLLADVACDVLAASTVWDGCRYALWEVELLIERSRFQRCLAAANPQTTFVKCGVAPSFRLQGSEMPPLGALIGENRQGVWLMVLPEGGENSFNFT